MLRRMNVVLWIGLLGFNGCSGAEEVGIEPAAAATQAPAAQPTVVAETDIPADIHRDSWARLPIPDRDTLDADGQRAYDVIAAPGSRYEGAPRSPVAMWIYSPIMAEHIFPASTYLRFETENDQRLTELVILATAREARSQYEWSSHEPLALRAGLEPEIVDIVKRRAPLDANVPGFGDRERTIVQFVREVMSEESVGSETFARARVLFGEKGVMDLTGLIGYYSFVDITLKAFDVQLAPGRERRLPDLW
jgi:4-carboxymuconolactone decarboxylase